VPRTPHYRSQAVTRCQVAKALQAFDFTERQGFPLTLMLNIHWALTPFAYKDRKVALAKLLESQRHWTTHRSLAFKSIAVRETGGMGPMAEHVHQLIYIPADLTSEFIEHVRQFLRGGARLPKGALQWDHVYSRGCLAYMCKGATVSGTDLVTRWPPTQYERERFACSTAEKRTQGIIHGKRLFISRALGKRAQSVQLIAAPHSPRAAY
jgi:hypothetical protein